MSILQEGHGDPEKENELPKLTQQGARPKLGRDTWLYRLVTGSPYPVLSWHGMTWTGSWEQFPILLAAAYQVWRNIEKIEVRASKILDAKPPMQGSAQACFFVFSLSVTVLELGCPGSQTAKLRSGPRSKAEE